MLLAAFLLSFGFIRMSARLLRSPKVTWWPGSIKTEGGLHVHHLVFGIVLLLLAGFLAFSLSLSSPWLEITAGAFGIGAGLTLDEFALWLHLEDVYWAEEGRRSMDAVIVATVLAGLILLGASPLEGSNTGSVVEVTLTVLTVLAFALITLLKGKYTLGIAALVFPFVGLVGAIRLAQPDSPWARWRYPPDGRRMRRATARFARHTARYRRWQDRIAGAPTAVAPEESTSSGTVTHS